LDRAKANFGKGNKGQRKRGTEKGGGTMRCGEKKRKIRETRYLPGRKKKGGKDVHRKKGVEVTGIERFLKGPVTESDLVQVGGGKRERVSAAKGRGGIVVAKGGVKTHVRLARREKEQRKGEVRFGEESENERGGLKGEKEGYQGGKSAGGFPKNEAGAGKKSGGRERVPVICARGGNQGKKKKRARE